MAKLTLLFEGSIEAEYAAFMPAFIGIFEWHAAPEAHLLISYCNDIAWVWIGQPITVLMPNNSG
jgi:hypothetical protein